jgi:hypothetical protein
MERNKDIKERVRNDIDNVIKKNEGNINYEEI